MTLNISINHAPQALPDDATVADALAHIGARPPFAVAVNTTFVPQARYTTQLLHDGDRIEVISPITGG